MDFGAKSSGISPEIGTGSTEPFFNYRPSLPSVPSIFGTGASLFDFGTGAPVFGAASTNSGLMASSSAPSFAHIFSSNSNSTGSGFALSTAPVSNGTNGGDSSTTIPAFPTAPASLFGNVPSVFGTGFAQGSIASTSATSSTHRFTGFDNFFATSGTNASSNIPVSTAGATSSIFAATTTASAPQFTTCSSPFGTYTHNSPGFSRSLFCNPSGTATANASSTASPFAQVVSSSPNSRLFGTTSASTSTPFSFRTSLFQTSSTAVTTAAPLATISASHPLPPTRFVIRRESPSNLITPTISTYSAPSATQFTVSVSISAPDQEPVYVSVSAPTSAPALASTPQLCQRCGHSATAYSPTPDNDDASYKVNSISAMPAYSDMSHEELRWAVHPSRVNAAASGGNFGFSCRI